MIYETFVAFHLSRQLDTFLIFASKNVLKPRVYKLLMNNKLKLIKKIKKKKVLFYVFNERNKVN